MKTETVAIGDIHLDPSNVRRHDDRNVAAIAASLTKFGQVKPIVIDSKGVCIAGNGTVEAARRLEWPTVEVVRTDLTGVAATAYSIADNQTALLADWAEDELAATLRALRDDPDIDELVTGFDAAEIDDVLSRGTMPTEADWAETFEQNGDTSEVDQLRQITFTLTLDDHKRLIDRLSELDDNKNIAIVKWLSL